MKVFRDIFSHDEVLSDAIGIKLDYEDSIITVLSKMINPDDVGNVDIGCGNSFGGGDEDTQQGGDTGVEKVNNIISNFGYEEFFGSKKEIAEVFKTKIEEMREKLKENPDALKRWEKGGSIEKFVKVVFGKFDDCQFYMGKSYGDEDPKEGMLIVAFWVDEEKDTGPTFHLFKDCLKEIKV